MISTAYGQSGSWASGYHTGIDMAVPIGTPVRATGSGVIISADWQASYGIAVAIKHDDGIFTLSAHLSSVAVVSGQRVSPGETIGLSGSTGNSTGPHLHFESRTQNAYGSDIDPVTYLRDRGVSL
ncbi:M23 family metallopeptidase [Streptomyces xanthophaeus]|uniref:M23 family metallopeptidase n=1 Tax=Streptomyces xanthophaeus TaxID=67385 RepID=UPI0036C98968